MGTNLSLPVQGGESSHFFISLYQGSQLAWWAEIVTLPLAFFFFSGRSHNLGKRLLISRLPCSHGHPHGQATWCPWFLVILCLHAGVGVQPFLLSLGCWVSGVPPLEVLPSHVLARPCQFLKHHPREWGSPRGSQALGLAGWLKDSKGLPLPSTALGTQCCPSLQDASALSSALHSVQVPESRKPTGCVYLLEMGGDSDREKMT